MEEERTEIVKEFTLELASNVYMITVGETGEVFVYDDRDVYKVKDMLVGSLIDLCQNNGKISIEVKADAVNQTVE